MNSTVKTSSITRDIVINGLSIALVFIATGFINIRLPLMANGGLIHLGNVPLFMVAIIFGKKTGALAGAFGMALFDVFSGWTPWAPFTFVIVGLMGYAVGKMTEKENHKNLIWYATAIAVALVIKIVGYYIAEALLYGNWVQPKLSIPGNVVQILVATVIVLPTVEKLKKLLALAL